MDNLKSCPLCGALPCDQVNALLTDEAAVERAARAIARLHVLEEDVERHWRSFIPDARAALAAAYGEKLA